MLPYEFGLFIILSQYKVRLWIPWNWKPISILRPDKCLHNRQIFVADVLATKVDAQLKISEPFCKNF